MQAAVITSDIPRPKGRRGNPNWRKGVSPNPGGKSKTPPDVKALCRELTIESIDTLAKCMRDVDAAWSTRSSVAQFLIERGWGRAPIMVDPEAANQVGASFAALLDAIANQSQVEQPPMINVTPEPSEG